MGEKKTLAISSPCKTVHLDNSPVVLKTDGEIIEDIRISCGVAAPTPIRCINAEKIGKGIKISEENIDKISKETLSNTKARDSWRGSKAFRQHLVIELARRGILELCGLKHLID